MNRALNMLVCVVLVGMAVEAKADWEVVQVDQDGTRYFVDLSNAQLMFSARRVRLAELIDYGQVDRKGVKSVLTLFDFDCVNGGGWWQLVREYSGPMGRGVLLSETRSPSQDHPAAFLSMSQMSDGKRAEWRLLCGLLEKARK